MMEYIATLGKRHDRMKGYSVDLFVSFVKKHLKNKIIVASYDRDDAYQHGLAPEIIALAESTESEIQFCGTGKYNYQREYEKLLLEKKEDPSFVTKKNIMEMMDTTIWTYLEGFWNGPERVNSETTDSIFSARMMMLSSFIPDVHEKLWLPCMSETVRSVTSISGHEDCLVLADVENLFYLKKSLGK